MWETGEAQGSRGFGSLYSSLQGRQEGMCMTELGEGGAVGWLAEEGVLWAYPGARP